MRRHPRTLIAAVTALALLAAACGGGGGDDKAAPDNGGGSTDLPSCPVDAFKKAPGKTEVVLWEGAYVGRTSAALKSIADAYNASQDKVTVRVEKQGASYDELRRNYEQAMNGKQLPAIVAGEDTWTQFMMDNGTALPAQSCIDADKDPRAKMGDLLPSVKAAYSVDGVQWPAAFAVSTVVLYYNKTAFQKAGLDPTKPPTTLAEVKDAAAKLKAAGLGKSGPLVMKMDPWYLEHLVTGVGQTVVNNDNGRNGKRATATTFDEPAMGEAMDFLSSMKKEGLLNPVANSKLIDHYLAVATESSDMLFETSTAITLIAGVVQGNLDLKKELGDTVDINIPAGFKVPFEVGVAPYPGIKAPGKGQVGGSAWYITTTGSPEVQSAAWDFIKYFNQVDNQVKWTAEGSYLPIRDKAQQQLEADPTWAGSLIGQWITTAYNAMKTLDAKFPGPLIGPYDEFRDDLGQAMESVTIQGADPKAALKTAATEIDAALKKYNDTNF